MGDGGWPKHLDEIWRNPRREFTSLSANLTSTNSGVGGGGVCEQDLMKAGKQSVFPSSIFQLKATSNGGKPNDGSY
jgi:hypothetical protein